MNYRALYGENADENEVRERYRSVAEGFRALKGEPPSPFIPLPDARRSSAITPITIREK